MIRPLLLLTAGMVWLASVPTTLAAQEFDPGDPAALASDVPRMELIVVGTFRVHWVYPWFDGWRYSGALHVDEVLRGNRKLEPSIDFRWKETYGASCLICEQMSRLDGERGIWFLIRAKGEWTIAWTLARWCNSYPLSVRGAVEKAIRDDEAKKPGTVTPKQ